MGVFAPNEAYDEGLEGIKNNVTEVIACSAEPSNFTEANATFALARVTVDNTDFTIAAGTPDGRRVTVAALTLTGEANGTATHLALVDQVNDVLYFVTPCTSVGITDTVDQDFSEWYWQISPPSEV